MFMCFQKQLFITLHKVKSTSAVCFNPIIFYEPYITYMNKISTLSLSAVSFCLIHLKIKINFNQYVTLGVMKNFKSL